MLVSSLNDIIHGPDSELPPGCPIHDPPSAPLKSPTPPLDLHLPWTIGRTQCHIVQFLDSRGDYCGHVQIHQTPRSAGFYDEERRRACAALILQAVNSLPAQVRYHEAAQRALHHLAGNLQPGAAPGQWLSR